MNIRPVALGARLKQYPSIQTLGFKPNFQDYSNQEKNLILGAKKIYYPTAFYADLFNAMGKETFPSFHTYKFALDKIKQTAAFNMLGIPHPETKIFYGKKPKTTILSFFAFPFIAKKAKGSAKGNDVYLIQNAALKCDWDDVGIDIIEHQNQLLCSGRQYEIWNKGVPESRDQL